MCPLRAHGPGLHHLAPRAKHRRGIAEAGGLEGVQRRNQAGGDGLKFQFPVVGLHGNPGVRLHIRPQPGVHGVPERLQILRQERQSRRLSVAAKLLQKLPAAGQGGEDVHALDAPAGAGQPVSLVGQQDHRIVVLLHQPRRRKPDHAGIPVCPGQYDRPPPDEVEIHKLRLGLRKDALLHGPALGILLLQFLRQRPGFPPVLRRHQLQRAFRRAQSPARVQPGGQLEGDVAGGDLLPQQPRRLDQRGHAGPGTFFDGVQAQLHDDAVLPHQRHHVRHRRQRRHVHVGHGRALAAQGPHQLPGHPRPAQGRKGIAIQQRVHHRAVRQHRRAGLVPRGLVMVGDNHREAQLHRQRHQRHAGHAAVHRHQQLRPPGDLPDGGLVQAVALVVPGGQVHPGIRALALQPAGENGRGAHAVHVVVPIHADDLALLHGQADPRRRPVHVRKPHRVVQVPGAGAQKGLRCLPRGDPPRRQQPVQHRRKPGGARETFHILVAQNVAKHDNLESVKMKN